MNWKTMLSKRVMDIPVWMLITAAMAYCLAGHLTNWARFGKGGGWAWLAINASICGACLLFAQVARWCIHPESRRKGVVWAIALTAGFPLLGLAAVYLVLPAVGLRLHKPHVPFRWDEFLGKTISAYTTVFMGTLIYSFFYMLLLKSRRTHEMERAAALHEKAIATVKANQVLHSAQSHFIRHLLHDILGRAEKLNDAYIPEQINYIARTWDFIAEAMDKPIPLVHASRALKQLEEMAQSIKRRYNDRPVIQLRKSGEPREHIIAPLVLSTLLENADTHGWVDAAHPILADIAFTPGRLVFTCTNWKRPHATDKPTTGRGLQLVRQSLLLLDGCHHTLERDENEQQYTIRLTINYTTYD
ncbi:hypothetical protein SAMN05660226_02343 [Parapedobacter luteus]|uniref:Signal transduction histidine kinase internal region domain-containing protein n=1 Tax=Parapedobacter luteus TaxID=623280 RepID=A0A1T5CU88_9SPHI|nr:hypothetical protein [Parapedobacter luteus]SKB62893.1 hypothetical protein SAMN05660226_02343 [Parapedobacter luteus]